MVLAAMEPAAGETASAARSERDVRVDQGKAGYQGRRGDPDSTAKNDTLHWISRCSSRSTADLALLQSIGARHGTPLTLK